MPSMALTKPMKLRMVAGSSYIPKDNLASPRSEDAHFICEEAQVIGVADGVGGWSKEGIDAGKYARQLIRNAANSVKVSRSSFIDPKNVLKEAFLNTSAQGSSTACIIWLDGNFLRTANLGDSGFMVIRRGDTVYRSEVQQYEFNFPYQLGNRSKNILEEAEEMVVELESGDVFVAWTDGLFDNLFPEDIEAAAVHHLAKGMTPAMVAHALAQMARQKSLQKTFSPFEAAAHEASVEYFGGKYDDITVIVAYAW